VLRAGRLRRYTIHHNHERPHRALALLTPEPTDWVANGVLFAGYHLHMPWAIPMALLDTFILAYPSKRYRSAWIGIAVHSAQSVVITALVLKLVV
jgi:hypothetical protein